jgi:hypothetical protein
MHSPSCLPAPFPFMSTSTLPFMHVYLYPSPSCLPPPFPFMSTPTLPFHVYLHTPLHVYLHPSCLPPPLPFMSTSTILVYLHPSCLPPPFPFMSTPTLPLRVYHTSPSLPLLYLSVSFPLTLVLGSPPKVFASAQDHCQQTGRTVRELPRCRMGHASSS